ncbi:hypothetical protein QTI33_19700 [Variovorax sp. J22P271]|uniref:hypothetical protein n=1 Tax=Variovorax davisae TaxID=3053515 RepID=UPI002578CF84|nr:hypothetical protein [Variovorax sp. J22P271]MDM0034369.1 hypothetical protein [Variovorax sp. J22P271]
MPPATPSIDELRQLESEDFSLVLGGPLFQLWRRSRLSDEVGNMPHRRALAAVLLAWAPLLLLSVLEGRAWGRVELPFLRDLELHARLLVALPLLILAELVVHRRMRLVVRQFLEDGLIPDASRSRFGLAVASALRLRNSVWAEVLLVLLVYGIGVFVVWRTRLTLDVSSWYGVIADGQLSLTAAGWWLACVSLPLFQFLLLRWYFRLFIWARFLWQVSRIRLDLIPTHPDRCGGLGFLSLVRVAFAPFLFAQGVLLAGMIADRIFFGGASLLQFEVEIAGVVALMVCVILGPLCAFGPQLEAAENRGRREYGTLAQRYAREFDHKWLRGGARPDEALIGSPDIRSLADMGNSFAIVEDMRWAPFTLRTVLHLAVTTLLPVLPLTLTMFSAQELLARLVKVLM